MNDHTTTETISKSAKRPNAFFGKTLAVVYDDPRPLPASGALAFPDDATAEWETAGTIDRIVGAWEHLGFEVLRMPLNGGFLSGWAGNRARIDLVHPLVEGWGSIAREGWIPALCELSGTPYIGSGPLAQCVAMKKSLLKIVCRDLGIPTARSALARTSEEIAQLPEDLLAAPHFLKPDCEGSGMGVDAALSRGTDARTTRAKAAELLAQYPDGVLVEELLPGEEYTSAIIGSPFISLPVACIEVDDGVYGLANKSKDHMGERVTFPPLESGECEAIESWSRSLAHTMGLRDFVRFDWKRDARGRVTFLEANPLAGLSYYYSVLPVMAREGGLPYEQLLFRLATSALARADDRTLWYGRARVRND